MIKLIKNLTKRDYIYALISFILIIVQVWLELKMPDFMSKVTILTQSDGSKMNEILLNGFYMMLCAFGSLISTIIVGYLVANISASFSLITRKKLFEKVEDLGVAEVKKFNVSSLITRTTNDITQIEMLIAMGLQLLIKAPITAIWAVSKILNKNFTWSMATLIAVLVLLAGSFRTIRSGEVGIKVRFGKVVSSKMHDGVNFKIPFIEKVVKMNVQVQKVEVETSSASKDLQDVNMRLAVNYRIVASKATELYKNVGTQYEEVVLQPAIQESIKAVTSKYTAEELITNRSEVSNGCMNELENKVKKYGLSIDNFNITNFSFSNEFNKAIEEKQVAEQKVLTAKQELEKEKIEAEKKIVKAEAERKANEMKGQTLTDNIIKEKFIEKWNGELPKVSGSSSIININDLIK